MSNKCLKCGAIIPEGRNYCQAHYLEELEQYKTDLRNYEIEKEQWDNSSSNIKKYKNKIKNNQVLRNFAAAGGLVLACLLWLYLHIIYEIDPLYGILIVTILPLAFYTIRPIWMILGRVLRSITLGGVAALIIGLAINSLKGYSPIVFDNFNIFLYSEIIICFGLSLFLEFKGKFNSNAAPIKPSPPKP